MLYHDMPWPASACNPASSVPLRITYQKWSAADGQGALDCHLVELEVSVHSECIWVHIVYW